MFRMERVARPAPDRPPTLREREPVRAPAPSGVRRVLVVEDESLIGLELHADLTRCGWTVVGPAQSLQEGMAVLDAGEPIDAAVLDVNLGGRTVYPLAAALQARGTPFVFCTGYEMVDPEGLDHPPWPILVYRYWVDPEYQTWEQFPSPIQQEAEAMRAYRSPARNA